jgi:PPK2 family polyphosphate:nucleotide phosphotransferase
MFQAVESPYLVPWDGSFRIAAAPAAPPDGAPPKPALRQELRRLTRRLGRLQRVLYAHDRWAVLLVFQALDAAGKDGTIRAVLTGVNPAGCQVSAFGVPSFEEQEHDFLWRTTRRLPERGRIGVFNRSFYEEVLVVRVHLELLAAERIPALPDDPERLWRERYESIRGYERHLASNGTVVLKFWLNVSREEQRRRFLARIEKPHKHWKFSAKDVAEREHWDDYREAYEQALAATSAPWAPWYAIPADNKPFMHRTVAEIVVRSVESLGLGYPEVSPAQRDELARMRELLD